MLSIRSDFIKGYTKGCISKRVIFKKGSYFKKGHISKKQYFKKDHISRMVIFHTGIIKGNISYRNIESYGAIYGHIS